MGKFLENKRVIIRIIPEKGHELFKSIDKQHIGKHFFPDCKKVFVLPLTKSTGGLVKLLTKEEQEFFEEALELEKGELSTNLDKAVKFKFWSKFTVELNQNDLVLDLSNPKDNLKDRVLSCYKDELAPSWEERLDKATYRWARVDEDYQTRVYTKTSDLKMKGYIELAKIKDNKAKLFDTLRLLGKTPSSTASIEWLYSEVGKIIETVDKVVGSSTVHDFLDLVEDKTSKTKLFIMDAIKLGEVTVSGSKYYIKGGDLIGNTKEKAIEWFDDNTNSETRKIIELRIKTSKE